MVGRAGANSWWLRAGLIAGTAALASTMALGCGSNSGPPPTAFVSASLMQGDSPSPCMTGNGATTEFLLMGPMSVAAPLGQVANGVAYEGSPANVSCTVSQSGTSYTVTAGISTGGGSFKLAGTMTTSGTQENLSVTVTKELTNAGGVTYSESDCTFAFQTPNSVGNPSIKPGAVWGVATCPNMMGSTPMNVCDGTISLQLTNCTQ